MSKRLTHDEIILAVLDACRVDDEEGAAAVLSELWIDKRFQPAVRKVCDIFGVDINEVKQE